MTSILRSFVDPAQFKASKAAPPDKAPSPITATTCFFSPLSFAAIARPKAEPIEVEACPVLKNRTEVSLSK